MKNNEFNALAKLENQLASTVANHLDLAIRKYGEAYLLVSGGRTPVGMYHLLSLKKINWEKVIIGLVDERFVNQEDDASNEKLIRNNLLINEASKAQFVSMVFDISNETNNLKIANEHYIQFHNRVDVAVLGMGDDGHTASLFPIDNESEKDLNSTNIGLISTRSPNAPFERISCSKELLLNSQYLYLIITGQSKLQVLNNASSKLLPISYFFEPKHEPLEIYYTEKN